MATPSPDGRAPARRRKLENELRASLVFFFGGVILLGAWGLFSVFASVPTGPGSSFWAIGVGMGSVLLLVGGACAGINWALLRGLPSVSVA